MSILFLSLSSSLVFANELVGKLVEMNAKSIHGKNVQYDALYLSNTHQFTDEHGAQVKAEKIQLIYLDNDTRPKVSSKQGNEHKHSQTEVKVDCKNIIEADSPYHYEPYLCVVHKIDLIPKA